jgi:hypothetical protein
MDIYTFDFDEWATLAKSAPDVFEQRRHEYVEHLISGCTNPRRLRGLQCHIDMERIRARTAMKSCLRISSLMWDSFLDCQDALDAFVHRGVLSEKISALPARRAQIIPLRRKSSIFIKNSTRK